MKHISIRIELAENGFVVLVDDESRYAKTREYGKNIWVARTEKELRALLAQVLEPMVTVSKCHKK